MCIGVEGHLRFPTSGAVALVQGVRNIGLPGEREARNCVVPVWGSGWGVLCNFRAMGLVLA